MHVFILAATQCRRLYRGFRNLTATRFMARVTFTLQDRTRSCPRQRGRDQTDAKTPRTGIGCLWPADIGGVAGLLQLPEMFVWLSKPFLGASACPRNAFTSIVAP